MSLKHLDYYVKSWMVWFFFSLWSIYLCVNISAVGVQDTRCETVTHRGKVKVTKEKCFVIVLRFCFCFAFEQTKQRHLLQRERGGGGENVNTHICTLCEFCLLIRSLVLSCSSIYLFLLLMLRRKAVCVCTRARAYVCITKFINRHMNSFLFALYFLHHHHHHLSVFFAVANIYHFKVIECQLKVCVVACVQLNRCHHMWYVFTHCRDCLNVCM